MSSHQKALFLESEHGQFVIRDALKPTPGPDDLLVKLDAVALNPADWKVQVYGVLITHYPAILGVDGAGTVEELGENVKGFSKGDKV